MSDDVPERFPFGRPVLPCKPSADGPRRLFLLGAYPSALHVRWVPPSPESFITAMAVDNEPSPFWTGLDEVARVATWKTAVEWRTDWGTASPAKGFNGPSGAWVAENVLAPLGAERDDAWITDCLDTYRCSTDLQRRLTDTYAPFAARLGLPSPRLARHPAESAIAHEAVTEHRGRLLGELDRARPELLVTLGNAALRVMRRLVEAEGAPVKLAVDTYGQRLDVRIGGRLVEWLPLAHPAAPRSYQEAHARWVTTT